MDVLDVNLFNADHLEKLTPIFSPYLIPEFRYQVRLYMYLDEFKVMYFKITVSYVNYYKIIHKTKY